MSTTTAVEAGTVPVGPALSMFDPVYLGIDEYRQAVYSMLVGKHLLVAGESGGGKSTAINDICGHAALSTDARLCLLDGKLVELAQWAPVADIFAHTPDEAITALLRLQTVMNNRYAWLLAQGRRKLSRDDRLSVILCVVDELAVFTRTAGTKTQQEQFLSLVMDVVMRGRACGVAAVLATQRPSGADTPPIIPASLRDNMGNRLAFRCTTDDSSDLVLGRGWAQQGYTANSIAPEDAGVGLLLAEGGIPRRIRVPFHDDAQIKAMVDYAAWIRRTHTIPDPAEAAKVLPITVAA
jgi:S-DNA-T family DNA segregation ATPase FtsK/SpoIIIE